MVFCELPGRGAAMSVPAASWSRLSAISRGACCLWRTRPETPHMAHPPLAAVTVTANSPELALPASGPPASGNHLIRNVALAGAGVAGAAAGGVLWWLDGRGTDCEADPVGPTVCPAGYRTATIGVPVMIAGAALALAGVVLIVREHGAQAAQLAIGPGAMRLEAKF